MKKTVNQWLDIIQSLPEAKRKLKEVHEFYKRLTYMNLDESYKGQVGTEIVEVDDILGSIIFKPNKLNI